MVQKRFTAQPSFSNALGLSPQNFLQEDSGLALSVTRSTEGVAQYRYRYVIPQKACVISIDGKEYVFSTSAILAIFDEFTTLAIVNEDRKTRPGVSTNLSTNLSPHGMTQLPKAGDALDIFVKVIKIGKTFGFTEAEAKCSETGITIATGKHTKFLNTGSLIQNAMLGQTMLPIVSHVASTFQPNDSVNTNTISMNEILRLDASKYIKNAKMLVLRKEHLNPMGSCHGGAIAIAMEQFVNTNIIGSHKRPSRNDQNLRLQSMSINYVSTAKEHLLFASENTCRFESSTMVDVNVFGDHGRMTANGVLHYFSMDKQLRETSSRL